MTSMVDQNKHYSDQTAKRAMMFLDRRQSDKELDLPLLFFLLRKRWSISENIPIVVGTIPLLACIPVLSGNKIYEKTRPSTFFTLRHKLIKQKGNLWAKNVLFGTFQSKPVQQVSYRPGRSIIVASIYRPPNNPIDPFLSSLDRCLRRTNQATRALHPSGRRLQRSRFLLVRRWHNRWCGRKPASALLPI